jgi:hypothetical protein
LQKNQFLWNMMLRVTGPNSLGSERCNPVTACPNKIDVATLKSIIFYKTLFLYVKYTYKSFE